MVTLGFVSFFRTDCFGLAYVVGLLRYQQTAATPEGTELPVAVINLARDELNAQLSQLLGMVSRLEAKPQTPITDQYEAELIQAAENILNKRFHCEMVFAEINSHPSIWTITANGPRLTEEHDSVCELYERVDDAMQKKISELSVCVGGTVWNDLRTKSGNRPAFIWYLGDGMIKAYDGTLGA